MISRLQGERPNIQVSLFSRKFKASRPMQRIFWGRHWKMLYEFNRWLRSFCGLKMVLRYAGIVYDSRDIKPQNLKTMSIRNWV